MRYASPHARVDALDALIDLWCQDRCLRPLARLLPAYLALNGLGDGWAALLGALHHTRALGEDAFSLAEWDTINALITALGQSVLEC